MEDPTYQIFALIDQNTPGEKSKSFSLKKIFSGFTAFVEYDDAVRWIETKGQKDNEYVILSVYKT